MKAKLIKTKGDHYDLKVESIGLYTSTYQWTSNGNLLSKENYQAIERGYDLDELAEEFAKNHSIYPTAQDDTKYGFKHGFQKALEVIGDKKFREEDMNNAIDMCIKLMNDKGSEFREHKQTIIQSLQQTEWDVEVDMEKKLVLVNGYENQPKNVIGFVTNYFLKSVPKLDADGCLILKIAK